VQNTHLIARWNNRLTVPELYYIRTTKSGVIKIFLTQLCWTTLQRLFHGKDVPDQIPSLEECWGVDKVLNPIKKQGEHYVLTIGAAVQKNEIGRKNVCKSLSGFFRIINYVVLFEVEEERQPRDDERLQLLCVDTYWGEEAMNHSYGMGVSMSPETALFLIRHSQEEIPGVRKAMLIHHKVLYPEIHKERNPRSFMGWFTGVIRELGTISFITMGDCACLGQMPKETQLDEGLYADSHNLDNPGQQLNMIVGISIMWEWVQTALYPA
jgi:hypothetical protein